MHTRLRILHLVDNLNGYGQTRQLELLVEHQMNTGHEVRLLVMRAQQNALATFGRLGVTCHRLHRRWHCDPFAALRMTKEMGRRPCDVLHLWGHASKMYHEALHTLLPATATLCSLPGRTLCNDMPVEHVAAGVDPPTGKGLTRRQFLAELSLPVEATLIAAAGPLTRTQRIDDALWNFELVRTLEERSRLLVFGDGADRHRLERFARKASESHAIRFLGYRGDFRELLAHVDLFWHTAEAAPTIPRTMLEAMIAGVPVVANDGPGCRVIIEEGESGFLIPNNDRALFARQTRHLLDSPPIAEQIQTKARETVARSFSLTAMLAAFDQLYTRSLHQLPQTRVG